MDHSTMLELFREGDLVAKISAYPYPRKVGERPSSSVGFFVYFENCEMELIFWSHQIRQIGTWYRHHKKNLLGIHAILPLVFDEQFGSSAMTIVHVHAGFPCPKIEWILLFSGMGGGTPTSFTPVTISDESMGRLVEYLESFDSDPKERV